jgi:hypothetical protein
MAKDKVTLTIDRRVLADAADDAAAAGLNRSQYVEKLLHDDHYRRLLASATPSPMSPQEEKLTRQILDWQRDPSQNLQFPGSAA